MKAELISQNKSNEIHLALEKRSALSFLQKLYRCSKEAFVFSSQHLKEWFPLKTDYEESNSLFNQHPIPPPPSKHEEITTREV